MADSAFTLNGGGLSFSPGGVRSSTGTSGAIGGGNIFTPNIDLPKVPYQPSANAAENAKTIEALTLARQHGYDYNTLRANNQAIADSIDPTSGEFNQAEYQKRAAIDPQVAQHYAATLSAVNEAKQRQIGTAKAQLEQGIQRQTALIGMFEGLMAKTDETGKPVPPSSDDIFKMGPQVMRVLGLDYNNPKDLAFLAQNTIDLTGSGNPEEIKTKIQQKVAGMQQTAERMKNIYGQLEVLDTGPRLQPVTERERTQTLTPSGAPIAKALTPGEAATPVQGGVTAGGAPTTVTKGQIAAAGNNIPGVGTPMALSPEAEAQQRAGVESAKDVATGLNEAAQNWIPLETFMQAEREALAKFKAGGATGARAAVAKAAQAAKDIGLPISDDTVAKIAGGDLAEIQKFQASAASSATGMMKQAVQGTGRAMLPEVEIFLSRYGDLTNDPRALEKIYDFTVQIGKKLRNMQKDYASFVTDKANGKQDLPYGAFPSWANSRAQERGDVKFLTSEELQRAGEPRAARSVDEALKNAGVGTPQIKASDAEKLKANPSAKNRAYFEKHYGAGSADRVLNGR